MTDRTTIAFDDLGTGPHLRDRCAALGVTVSIRGARGSKMIDHAAQEPSGAASGSGGGWAEMVFDFDEAVLFHGLTLAGVQQGAGIRVHDAVGRSLSRNTVIGATGAPVAVTLDIAGAAKVVVEFHAGGTIETLHFTKGARADGAAAGSGKPKRAGSRVMTGAMIATPRGEVAIEALEVGDTVITRDDAAQAIRRIARRDLTAAELDAAPSLRPIRIGKGALGQGLPERDLLVAPQHRILVAGDGDPPSSGAGELLVAARHLIGRPGIERMGAQDVTYFHLLFETHQVVLTDGVWTESFQPGDTTAGGLLVEQRDALLALFPELAEEAGRLAHGAARRALKRREAALLHR